MIFRKVSIYLPISLDSLTLKGSSLTMDIQASNITSVEMNLLSSATNMALSNISNATLELSSAAKINVQGSGKYNTKLTSSAVKVNAPHSTCLQVTATSSSIISYPEGSVIGTGSGNLTQSTCVTDIILQSTSSVVSIMLNP